MVNVFTKLIDKISDMENSNKLLIARIYLISNYLCIAIAGALIKRSTQSLNQILYLRGILILITNLYISKKQSHVEHFYVVPYKKQITLAYWAFFFALQTPISFLALRKIAMAEALIIQLTNTIWSQFIGVFLLSEKLTCSRFYSLLLSLFGVSLVVRPPFLFSNIEMSIDHLVGCIYALIASVVQAFSFLILKLVGPSVGANVTTQYFHLGNLTVCSVLMIFSQQQETNYSIQYFIELVVIAFGSYWSHFLSFRAYSLVSYSKLAPLAFTGLLWNILLDILIFGKPPGLLSLIGICIIIFSISISLREKMQAEKK